MGYAPPGDDEQPVLIVPAKRVEKVRHHRGGRRELRQRLQGGEGAVVVADDEAVLGLLVRLQDLFFEDERVL